MTRPTSKAIFKKKTEIKCKPQQKGGKKIEKVHVPR